MRAILKNVDEEGRGAPSVPELAEITKTSVRTVQRGLRELESLGWIATKLRPISYKFNDTNLYTVLPRGRSAGLPRGLRNPPRDPADRRRKTVNGDSDRTGPSLYSGPSAGAHAFSGSDPVVDGVQGEDEPLPPGLDAPFSGEPLPESHEEGGDPENKNEPPVREEASQEGATSTGTPERSGGDLPEDGRPQAQQNVMGGTRGGTPKGGALAPSEIARARIPSRMESCESIRQTLIANGMADLAGGGFERRLDDLRWQRKIHPADWLAMLSHVGGRRIQILFDANGKPTKWSGSPEDVRGVVYVTMRREPEPEEAPKPKPFPKVSLWKQIERMRPSLRPTLPVEEPSHRVHDGEVANPANACARRIVEALGAEYHGVRSLADIAEMDDVIDFANRVAQLSESSACGGKLTDEDVIATIEHFATMEAFKTKRGELQAPSVSLRNFLVAQLRKTKRGSAEAVRQKVASAKFYDPTKSKKGPKVDTRQPGDLSHLRKPKPEINQEEAMKFLNSLRSS